MPIKHTFTVTIQLESDMCCGTGETARGIADQLTAVDSYGLPIIPAKRLKSLLRESAELITLASQKTLIGAVFGGLRGIQGKARFSTAELVYSSEIKAYIDQQLAAGNPISPQKVTEVFTSVRFNTAISPDGIAKNKSLRSTQVVNKRDPNSGLVKFKAMITGDDFTDYEIKLIEDSVKALRRIGLNKSRGFGEVQCTVDTLELVRNNNKEKEVSLEEDIITVPYQITLLQDVILGGGIGEDLDYFPGSMIQGAFAQFIPQNTERYRDNVLKEARFSNAYIDIPIRGTDQTVAQYHASQPVPRSIVMEKNETLNNANPLAYDLAHSLPELTQSQAVSGYVYFGETEVNQNEDLNIKATKTNKYLVVKEVSSGYSFHNSLITSPQGKQFYSFKRTAANQRFSGTITASKAFIKSIEDILNERGNEFDFGTSKGTEFGHCRFELKEPIKSATHLNIEPTSRILVHFLSDVIFIDKDGSNTTDIQRLVELLNETQGLGFTFVTDDFDSFIKTTTIGGYNSYWKLPKRQYQAFKKGSVLILKEPIVNNLKDDGPHKTEGVKWIGYLQNEGYGQIALRTIDEADKGSYLYRTDKTNYSRNSDCTAIDASNDNTKMLIDQLLFNELKNELLSLAISQANESELLSVSKSALSNLQQLFINISDIATREDQSNKLFVQRSKEFFYKPDKPKNTTNILHKAAESIEVAFDKHLSEKDNKTVQLAWNEKSNELFNIYAQAYFQQVRALHKENTNGGESE
ncbi:MAG: RAMP superfamily CRISPR-associated protein [Coriobacteriia bacterium]|nr:RAMP superfamily CRISPR-associated protein [Coriobacteriia bacterium]